MNNRNTLMLAVLGTLALAAASGAQAQDPAQIEEQVRQRTEEQLKNAGEADQVRTQQQTEQAIQQHAGQPEGAGGLEKQAQQQKRIYGEELMTAQERNQYQERLQVMKTDEERKAFNKEHKKQMQERAKQQGKSLNKDGSVMTGDQLKDRDQDRDRTQQMDQTSRPMPTPAPAPAPGKGGGGGGHGGG